MRFRFTLTHVILGSLEINEPDGWISSILKLERDENFHSLIEYFSGSFIFYGNNGIVNGGIDYIKNIEQNYGLDEKITVDIDLTFDEVNFSNVFSGQFNFADLEEMPNNKMRLPIIRDDFWAKFISRLDTPVNIKSALNLDDEVTTLTQEVNLKLETQVIEMKYQGDNTRLSDPGFNQFLGFISIPIDDDLYFQVDWDHDILDEIKEKYNLPVETNPVRPAWLITAEYGGNYIFNIVIYAWMSTGGPPTPVVDGITGVILDFTLRLGSVDHAFTHSTEFYNGVDGTDGEVSKFTFSSTLPVNPGDYIFIYGKSNRSYSGVSLFWMASTFVNKSTALITAETVFPQTNNSGFLIHDVAAAIITLITGVNNSFWSDLLGSPFTQVRQYVEYGCAWAYSLIKGLQLRQYTLEEKPFFMSFNQFWRGANPILNLSLCYDTIDGQPVIRIEHKGKEYDDSEGTSIDFSNVRDITRKYDNDRIFNKASIGYTKWESENTSGIDDPQTKKHYSDALKKTGKGLELYSEYIAASLAIETTRRTTKEKSSDYKYDNETFIIALNPNLQEESPDVSPDLLQFIPELDENFTSVTGLLHPETRYNLKLTPARNFLRWQNYFQGALQPYIGSNIKFASGEGNYDMTSEMQVNGCLSEDYDGAVLSEKGDIPVTDYFIHLPHLYEAEIPMEWEEYETIRNNRRKPIGISLTDFDHVPMFIKTLEYKPVKGTATCLLWAKEYLDLSIVHDTTPMQECMPESDDCEDALTDLLGNILTDELGVCITD